jgi:hypothetical protein
VFQRLGVDASKDTTWGKVSNELFVEPVLLSCLALQRARGRLLIDALVGIDWRR